MDIKAQKYIDKSGMVTGCAGLFGWPPKKIVVICKKPKVKTFKTKQTRPLVYDAVILDDFVPQKL